MQIGQVGKICFSRLFEDEDLADGIKKRVEESNVKAGALIVIGALKNVVAGCYKNGEYTYIRMNEPVEIASCMGNIALDEKGEIIVHAHLVVSNEKGEAFGGHLMKGCRVGPTAELVIIEGKGIDLQRTPDEKTKLKLLKLS